MKNLIALFIIFSVGKSFSQTSVSGGIYQNTTWTAAGSPYIVTGSMVVFPGKTLTIEPGCEVRFTADYSFNTGNFLYLEIRGTLFITISFSRFTVTLDSARFTQRACFPLRREIKGDDATTCLSQSAFLDTATASCVHSIS